MSLRGRESVYAVVLLGIGIATGELLVRVGYGTPWLVHGPALEEAVVMPHASRGYTLRPGARARGGRGGWEMEIRVNERGLRDSPFADSLASPFRVLAVGDSYTMGLGVAEEESWVEQLEGLLGDQVSVVNAGVPGYSPRQVRQMLEDLLPEVKPQLVVFGLYSYSFFRMYSPSILYGPHLVSSNMKAYVELTRSGDLVVTRFAGGWLRRVDVFFKQYCYLGAHLLSLLNGLRHWPSPGNPHADRPLESVRRDFRPTLSEIDTASRLARAAGAGFVVLLINHQEADGSFAPMQFAYNRVISEHCEAQGIPVVDPLPLLAARSGGEPIFRLPADAHWSPAAHRLAAESLHAYLAGRGLLPDRQT